MELIHIIKTHLKKVSGAYPAWPVDEKLAKLQYSYFWTKPSGSNCSSLAAWSTAFYDAIAGLLGESHTEGMVAPVYSDVGEYKAILNIYVVDGNGVCQGPFIDSVYVNVTP